ncbi:MAG: phosphohistidine phosphatase SixA [Vicinamibacterales bacterium]
MVQLYLIRHAVAEERGEKWPDDTKRPLTEDGVRRMRRAAKGLARLGARFDVVLTSPLLRAQQTAEIVAAAFETVPPVVTATSLAPDGSFTGLLADLQKHARHTRVALVGHEPSLGEFASRLTKARRRFEFKKGGACRIDIESIPPAGPGALRWLVTPAILRGVER